MSAFGTLWKIEFTYSLSQDNHGENVSVRYLVKNQIHVLSKPGQPRAECQRSVACENRIYVLPKPGQPREQCQRSVACETLNSPTTYSRTTVTRMSASHRMLSIWSTCPFVLVNIPSISIYPNWSQIVIYAPTIIFTAYNSLCSEFQVVTLWRLTD